MLASSEIPIQRFNNFSMTAATAAASAAGFFAGRNSTRAGRGEGGKFLGQLLRAAMRTPGVFPISRTDEDFAVAPALPAMKFVNRHEGNVAADVSRLKLISERTHVCCYEITATIFRGAADGRGSSGSRRRRWCLQKEIAASAIRRGRRKKPRWLCLDDARNFFSCCLNYLEIHPRG